MFMRFITLKNVGWLFGLGAIVMVALLLTNRTVENAARAKTFFSTAALPFNAVGLVPGTRPGGVYFRNRIDSAAELWRAGKVKWLVVSGDNRRASYNEPHEMQKALIEKGVPERVIYCDYAGFTTLDSVVRARDVFGQTSITVVSQAFQNERAIYLAQHYGIKAVGYNTAELSSSQQWWLGTLREYFARGRAVLDATLIRRQPHFGGPMIIPGENTADRCPASPAM
ncbi:YdcF family protein [Enterobacter kobei]|nr:YdcF family protein [Enterobacter kobei]